MVEMLRNEGERRKSKITAIALPEPNSNVIDLIFDHLNRAVVTVDEDTVVVSRVIRGYRHIKAHTYQSMPRAYIRTFNPTDSTNTTEIVAATPTQSGTVLYKPGA